VTRTFSLWRGLIVALTTKILYVSIAAAVFLFASMLGLTFLHP